MAFLLKWCEKINSEGIYFMETSENKKIWILNHYAGETFFDKGGRHYWIAKYLKRNGHSPIVFCCNVKHNPVGADDWLKFDGKWKEQISDEIGVPYVFIKAKHYTSNGIKRIRNMLNFAVNLPKVAKEYAKVNDNPDVIYASSVHPFTLVAGIWMAKRYKVKCICEIRDLWPESFIAYGIAGEKNAAVLLMRKLEKWIYKKADHLVFTMEGGYDYIRDQHWEKEIPLSKVSYINNGVDLEVFDLMKEQNVIEDIDLNNDNLFKVVYSGSIRKVNNVGKILDIAKEVKNPKVIFLIWGDGDELPALKERVEREGIANVVFKGRVKKEYIPYITSHASVNLAHNSRSPLFKYGISFNKLFEYFAAGKPIICDFWSKYNPALNEKVAYCVESGEAKEVAMLIDYLTDIDPSEFTTVSQNARAAAIKYSFSSLTKTLVDIIAH